MKQMKLQMTWRMIFMIYDICGEDITNYKVTLISLKQMKQINLLMDDVDVEGWCRILKILIYLYLQF